MSNEEILHVAVSGATDEELRKIRNSLRGTLDYQDIVVTTDDVSLAEIPALDEYADELADRVAEKVIEAHE